jgi:hypothetical protein
MAKTKYKRTNNDLYNIQHKTQNKDKQSKKHNTNKWKDEKRSTKHTQNLKIE